MATKERDRVAATAGTSGRTCFHGCSSSNIATNPADIALFAYTHVAHEGGFDLGGYPKINAWLDRVRGQPRFVPMRSK